MNDIYTTGHNYETSLMGHAEQEPLLLAQFNFNPRMDK